VAHIHKYASGTAVTCNCMWMLVQGFTCSSGHNTGTRTESHIRHSKHMQLK
jgi:hypothetical protein